MKIVTILILISVLLGCVSKSNLDKIQQAIDDKNLFEARTLFEKFQYKFNKTDYLYFAGIIQNGFDENQESIESFQKLFDECSDQLSDSLTIIILQLQLNNYQKVSNTEKALEIIELLQTKYGVFSDSLKLKENKNETE